MHQAVTLARDLIAIPSVNPMGRAVSGPIYSERQVAEYVQGFLARLGVDAEVMGADPAHPNVVAYVDAGSAETVMLEAHLDTVPPDNMTIDPFDPVIDGGRLYGRGSCDTKSSMASYLYALAHALRHGRTLRRNVLLVGAHSEEYSFAGAKELVSDRVRATFAVAGEPTSLNIVYAHKGICRFRVSTKGKSAHAALPWLGQNAIYRMARVLGAIEAYGESLKDQAHPELGPPTVNVGTINGGVAANIVPASCTVEVDRRLLPGEEFPAVRAALEEQLGELARQVEIAPPYLLAPGLYSERGGPASQSLHDACQAVHWSPEFQTAHYATDAAIYSAAGIPAVVFGPGSINLAHTAAEHVPVQEVEQAGEIILSLLTDH